MKYLRFDTVADAESRSREALVPPPPPGSVTVRMWEVLPHPSDGTAVLLIPPDTENLLTAAEAGALSDEAAEYLSEGYGDVE